MSNASISLTGRTNECSYLKVEITVNILTIDKNRAARPKSSGEKILVRSNEPKNNIICDNKTPLIRVKIFLK